MKYIATMNLLFVYGTLKSSFDTPMAIKLRENAEFICDGYVYGELYDLGEYPGLIVPKSEKRTKVFGEVYRVTNPSLMQELDEYEGVPFYYDRRLIQVHGDQKSMVAWGYIYKKQLQNSTFIQDGYYGVRL